MQFKSKRMGLLILVLIAFGAAAIEDDMKAIQERYAAAVSKPGADYAAAAQKMQQEIAEATSRFQAGIAAQSAETERVAREAVEAARKADDTQQRLEEARRRKQEEADAARRAWEQKAKDEKAREQQEAAQLAALNSARIEEEKRRAELERKRNEARNDMFLAEREHATRTMVRAKFVSDLAYAAANAKKDSDAASEVLKQRDVMVKELQANYENMVRKAGVMASNRADLVAARENLEYLKQLKVKDATRDAIAVTSDFDVRKKTVFGFRGTKELRDLIPDVQLALNMKKVGRLDQAREFVKRVAEKEKLEGKDMEFTGHSLGGFIGEGVRNGYVGSELVSFASGAPLAAMVGKDKKVKAWGDYRAAEEEKFDRENRRDRARITRVVSNGDLVSSSILKGAVENGRANLYSQDRAENGNFNLINNHKLKLDKEMAGKSQDGSFVGSFRDGDTAKGVDESGSMRKDASLGQRVKQSLGKMFETTEYVQSGSKFSNGVQPVVARQVNVFSSLKQKLLEKVGAATPDPKVLDEVKAMATMDWNQRMKGRSLEQGPNLVDKKKVFTQSPGLFGALARKLGLSKKPLAKVRSDAEIAYIKQRWADSRARARGEKPSSSYQNRALERKNLEKQYQATLDLNNQRVAFIQSKLLESDKQRLALKMKANKKVRSQAQEEAIKKRWDARRVARSQKRTTKKPARSAQQAAAIQKRWNDRKAARASGQSYARR